MFPQRLRILNKILRTYCISISAQNTKFSSMKRDRLALFFSLCKKNVKNCDVSVTVWAILIKFGTVTQNMSLECMAVKNYNIKNSRRQTAAISKIERSRRWRMGLSSALAVRHLGFLKLIFNGRRTRETRSALLFHISCRQVISFQKSLCKA